MSAIKKAVSGTGAGKGLNNFEQIGKVVLNLAHYSGQDLYADGAEDVLLEIAKNRSPVEYEQIIAENPAWPILYHLSPHRENIASWLPITRSDKVLEVGAGCGAVTGAFTKKAGLVHSVELSHKRSLINAYRHEDAGNLMIFVGNLQDCVTDLDMDYDYICLIGVLEYAQNYIATDGNPYVELLNLLKPHLAPGGRIVIAIENKYGLKYFAGGREDHNGRFFSGIEDYPGDVPAKTFSRNNLEEKFRQAGFVNWQFYYPYPDYKLPLMIWSDDRLPTGEEMRLCGSHPYLDGDGAAIFDEVSAYEGIIRDGLFPIFANSYEVVIGPEIAPIYEKYNVACRAPEYRIRTEIRKTLSGPELYKYPVTEAAIPHLAAMEVASESLPDFYDKELLQVGGCSLSEEEGGLYLKMDYIPGRTLEDRMDECLIQGDIKGARSLWQDYLARIGCHADMPLADYDLTLDNIIIDDNSGRWTLIDYEWVVDRAVDTKELAYRALCQYVERDEQRNILGVSWALEEAGIPAKPEETAYYHDIEDAFQHEIMGRGMSYAELSTYMSGPVIEFRSLYDEGIERYRVDRTQIYIDTGDGFDEKTSAYADGTVCDTRDEHIEMNFNGDYRRIRIDPARVPCVVELTDMELNGKPIALNKAGFSHNGYTIASGVFVFDTDDPQMIFDLQVLGRRSNNRLTGHMSVSRLTSSIAASFAADFGKRRR